MISVTLSSILWLVARTAVASPTNLPAVPSVPPGVVAPLPDDPMKEARGRYRQSDFNGARAILEPFLASNISRKQRSAGRLLLGRVYFELGLYNHASTQFYRVRRGSGGDAKVAAWYEAVADLERGRPHATIAECKAIIEKYKEGHRVSECMVLIGDAMAKQGRLKAAGKAYDEYLERPEHKTQLREEEMSLRIALATAEHAPSRAIPLLQHLALNHRFAATGASAKSALDDLAEDGLEAAIIPDDNRSRMALAVSLRRSGWVGQAWAMFEEISSTTQTDPIAAQWVLDNARSFARSTRHPIPGTLAEVAAYNTTGGQTGKRAWTIFEGWRKAGRWDKAAKWGSIGLEAHGKKWPWRGQRDSVAHAVMLTGDWAAASDAWGAALDARHGSQRLALFYRSLTAHLAGDSERADTGFTNLVTQGGRLEMPARYWRIRTREAAGKTNTMVDRTRIAASDKTGWYRLLLQPPQPGEEGWLIRDGSWRGPQLPELAEIEEVDAYPGVQVGLQAAGGTSTDQHRRLAEPEQNTGWAQLRWPFTNSERQFSPPDATPVPTVQIELPESYSSSIHHDPIAAMKSLRKLGNKAKTMWPDLEDAVHLAEAGLYDEVAPIVRAAYGDKKRIDKRGSPEERAQLAALNIREATWIGAIRAAQDHYSSVRFAQKLAPSDDVEAYKRLQFPIAHARELWPSCQRWNIDPFLVLSIMRQESIYNPDALSPTGAIGLMQFIKGTGAKVSALMNEPLFSPHKLYNPSVNLKYSVYYLRLLNSRFDGNFPIAVASYNGGPHHMSRAHRATMGSLDLDAFVEMIPRREPRDYVKKVIGFYQQYVELYGPAGAGVVLPKRLEYDNPEIVNF